MEKNMLGKNLTGISSAVISPNGKIGFHQKKYMAAMKNADEMLAKADCSTANSNESLNCGKLTRLIKFYKTGNGIVNN